MDVDELKKFLNYLDSVEGGEFESHDYMEVYFMDPVKGYDNEILITGHYFTKDEGGNTILVLTNEERLKYIDDQLDRLST